MYIAANHPSVKDYTLCRGQFVLYLEIPSEAEESQLLFFIVLPKKLENRIKQIRRDHVYN